MFHLTTISGRRMISSQFLEYILPTKETLLTTKETPRTTTTTTVQTTSQSHSLAEADVGNERTTIPMEEKAEPGLLKRPTTTKEGSKRERSTMHS
jgi:hypothetical protein